MMSWQQALKQHVLKEQQVSLMILILMMNDESVDDDINTYKNGRKKRSIVDSLSASFLFQRALSIYTKHLPVYNPSHI